MRELLNDLENGEHLSDADPMKRAQKQMRQPRPRRFYKEVAVSPVDEGHAVTLDGKTVKTPGRAVLAVPARAAAELIAAEFSAQGEEMDPVSMPVTRLVNTAIDGVAADTQAVLEDILRYASSDLICYRAEAPQRLVELQAEAWDPVLDWARDRLGARLLLAEGVIHVEQPREALAALGVHLSMRSEPLRLAGLHVMTSLTGSALLALAVDEGLLTVDEAWTVAHVDEDWNIAQWGEDAEAAARRAKRLVDMRAAAALLEALTK
ncbi:ATP12 family chaperone protein [Mesorhizobium xinjiangense]|uniref:ATP12 family chaperone protein n=1 Tax=Mesorhizobium xinjiangense TaxID=2678685 RepID=UPI0012ECC344|nr:ATP12 family protein [Mesorhizobium xinjiangense]